MIMQSTSTGKSVTRNERPQISARTKVYVLIAVWALAAVKTVIPFPLVSKSCMLGYKSGCSFAPISTLILVLAAVITYVLAKRKNII